MNKIEFSKLSTKEDMILAFNQLKDDYRQLFAINEDLQEENDKLKSQNKSLSAENSYYKHIINELEKWLKKYKIQLKKYDCNATITVINCILNKLKELKEDNK